MDPTISMPAENVKGHDVELADHDYDEDKPTAPKEVHEYEFVLLSPDEFEKEREEYRIPSPDTFHGDSKTSKQYLNCCKFQTASSETLSISDGNDSHAPVGHVFDGDSPALQFTEKSESHPKCSGSEDRVCDSSKTVLSNTGETLLGSLHSLPHESRLGRGDSTATPPSETNLAEAAEEEGEKPEPKEPMSPLKYEISVPDYAMDGSQNRFIQVTLLNSLGGGSCAISESLVSSGQVLTIPRLHSCMWLDCNTHFLSIEDLSSHISTSHVRPTKDQIYLCMWKDCSRQGKGFNARYKMMSHIRTHTGEKPHACVISDCDKSFTRLENLKIHMRTHTGEKPYKCPYEGCTRSYANSSDRFKHTKTHYDKKPFHCKVPGCDKCYTDPSSLRKHTRSHAK